MSNAYATRWTLAQDERLERELARILPLFPGRSGLALLQRARYLTAEARDEGREWPGDATEARP